ncbi:helix-turn-helix domain-containing protein [Nostocaceae cyanobacterium CENA369]|uniref:Helix-turn-helix domain-containing protein n=1 Tax=Dendronalium phyllosphericum CENA369 TaxID=1725256 RepID=A0A8J7I7S0_9NOST|nr:helix-turn-helix domain-containing protein [Dendronalium phyllosphericum]MBH8573167.1 helix-turn-helix domain-containing protein [Dendronalium phyllosphericum CENA369]
MTITSTYLLKVAENHAIEISQDELRSLLGQIETELHRSQVYRRAVARLQKLLGTSGEQAKILFKAVGREAIGLAFQQFAQHQKVADIPQDTNVVGVTSNIEQENISDLSSCIASVKLHSHKNSANPSNENIALPSQVATNTTKNPVKNSKNIVPVTTAIEWLKPNKKPSKTEIAKQIAAEQRIEQLRQIGQQLKQARESQNLSLSQLSIYTHISIHQMEAVENCNFELLQEDVILRGFIRLMGNALGLNGTILATSLPAPDTVKSVLPSWSESQSISKRLAVDIRPIHLYVGYTALVAGAVGGLSLISQQANADKAINPDTISPSSSLSKSSQKSEPTAKPGLKSSHTGVSIGTDIAPPEAL